MAKKFSELRAKMDPERVARSNARVDALLLEILVQQPVFDPDGQQGQSILNHYYSLKGEPLWNQTYILQRPGWTKLKLDSFLGDPHERRPIRGSNRSPMNLYLKEKVLVSERLKAFQQSV